MHSEERTTLRDWSSQKSSIWSIAWENQFRTSFRCTSRTVFRLFLSFSSIFSLSFSVYVFNFIDRRRNQSFSSLLSNWSEKCISSSSSSSLSLWIMDRNLLQPTSSEPSPQSLCPSQMTLLGKHLGSRLDTRRHLCSKGEHSAEKERREVTRGVRIFLRISLPRMLHLRKFFIANRETSHRESAISFKFYL